MLQFIAALAMFIACVVPPPAPAPIAPTRPAAPAPPAAAPPAAAPTFPETWFGHWKGDTQVIRRDGVSLRLTMELIVAPTAEPGRFEWTMIYDGADGRQERKYTLLAKDTLHGEFAIDEHNSIVLPAQLIGSALYSHFAVGDSRIATRNELVGAGTPEERLLVEMVTTHDSDAVATGGKDGNPEVRGWLAHTVQRADMRRVK